MIKTGAVTYETLRKKDIPQKTQTAYKLMRVIKNSPGKLFPLYAKPEKGPPQSFTVGEWYYAKRQRPKIGNKFLAYRPGIHAISVPAFPQGKGMVRGENRMWVEVLMPAMSKETQAESDATLEKGRIKGISKRLLGPKEAYSFKTNSRAVEAQAWPVAGSMKITRILSDKEVAEILTEAKLAKHILNSITRTTKDDARCVTTFKKGQEAEK